MSRCSHYPWTRPPVLIGASFGGLVSLLAPGHMVAGARNDRLVEAIVGLIVGGEI